MLIYTWPGDRIRTTHLPLMWLTSYKAAADCSALLRCRSIDPNNMTLGAMQEMVQRPIKGEGLCEPVRKHMQPSILPAVALRNGRSHGHCLDEQHLDTLCGPGYWSVCSRWKSEFSAAK